MGHRNGLGGWPLALGSLIAGCLAEANYRRLPVLRSVDSPNGAKVSIIVPARNEEQRIVPLLRSLERLEYPNYEVVVVDDASNDGTARLAEGIGTTVVRVDHLPDGWTGKAHACWQGAVATSGEWLLFTDADTIHHPGSLSAAIGTANATGAGLLSLLCRQQCKSFWERLLLPYAYALYFAGRIQMNASQRSAVANGQYILMRRSEYARMGGHRAVRGSIIEDVDLARRAYSFGVRILLLRGERFVDVRMYTGLASLWQGLSKNAASFAAVSPVFGCLTVLASVIFGAAFPRSVRGGSRLERIAVAAAPAMALNPWMRRFGVPVRYVLLYPLAAGTFQVIAFDSFRRVFLSGSVRWKGRRY
jgi:chlorobactene glucosyltransferase